MSWLEKMSINLDIVQWYKMGKFPTGVEKFTADNIWRKDLLRDLSKSPKRSLHNF